jgi:predicted aspartyl protease
MANAPHRPAPVPCRAVGGDSRDRRFHWATALLALLLCVAFAAAAEAEDTHAATQGQDGPAAETVQAPEASWAFPTELDRIGRILAPVYVNGQGPFRFVLDTGANRSVLSPRLVELLGLTLEAGISINVHGVTGNAVMPAVHVDRIEAGGLVLAQDQNVPVLPPSVLAGADGILGIDGLGRARVDVDFREDRVTIEPSQGRRAEPGMLTIAAELRHQGLLMTGARVGRLRVHAIIDTGAERSLGNLSLRRGLLLRPRKPAENAGTKVMGATPEIGEGTSLHVPRIRVGEAELNNLTVTFGDLYVFRVWDVEDQPTLLIGMDLLGTVERLVIDYRRREIQLKPWPKDSDTKSGRGRFE